MALVLLQVVRVRLPAPRLKTPATNEETTLVRATDRQVITFDLLSYSLFSLSLLWTGDASRFSLFPIFFLLLSGVIS
jgi:hypothetical protein